MRMASKNSELNGSTIMAKYLYAFAADFLLLRAFDAFCTYLQKK
jgi:hypothetical protein